MSKLALNDPRLVWTWLGVAALVAATAACSAPPAADTGGPGQWNRSSSLGPGCATPQTGCPCPTNGAVAPCGDVTGRSGNYVFCSQGQRTCSAGQWGACVGEQLVTMSAPVGDIHLASLGAMTTCTGDPCDPYCNNFVDTPTGITPPTGFTLPDGGGLALSGSTVAACTSLSVTPSTQTITVSTINTTTGAVTTTPTSVTFTAQCSGTTVTPSWTLSDYDVATITSAGQASVYADVAETVTVTATLGSLTATASLVIDVDVNDTSAAPSSAIATALSGTTTSGTESAVMLYPYNQTVFPLGLAAPLVQWELKGATVASGVKVSLDYNAGSGATFHWSGMGYESPCGPTKTSSCSSAAAINPPAPYNLTTNILPSYAIPQTVWSGFDRSSQGAVASASTAKITVQRLLGSSSPYTLHPAIPSVPLGFATAPLDGTLYYVQYLRNVTNAHASDSNVTDVTTPYQIGYNCPVGNGTHVLDLGGSGIRAINPSEAGSPTDPFNGTAGCPVCHSISASGGTFVSVGYAIDNNVGSSTDIVGLNTIGAGGAFTAVSNVPDYPNIFSSSPDWGPPSSRGFSYAAMTPDGVYGLQGSEFWGNTGNEPGSSANVQSLPDTLEGSFNVSNGSSSVSTTSSQVGILGANDSIWFGSQSGTTYTVSSVTSSTITLTGHYTGSSNSSTGATASPRYQAYKLTSFAGTFHVSNGSAAVSTTSSQVGAIPVGASIQFASQSGTYYTVSAVSSTALTLASSYTGTSNTATTILPPANVTAAVSGLGPTSMMAPSFSPDGTKLVFVNGDQAAGFAGTPTGWRKGLSVMSFAESTLTFSTPSVVVNDWALGLGTGNPIKWPFFEPDSQSIIFVETEPDEACLSNDSGHDDSGTSSNVGCYNAAYGNMAPTTRSVWNGDLYSVAINKSTNLASSGPVALAKINAGQGPADADQAYQPSVLPNVAGGYRWVIFTSQRPYGNQINQYNYIGSAATTASCATSQIWMAAIQNTTSGTTDRSSPAFWVPNQLYAPIVSGSSSNQYVNERGYIVPEACHPTGTGTSSVCATDTDCCSPAECRIDLPAAQPPTRHCATVSGTCSQSGGSCETSSDCCDGYTCVNGACVNAINYTQEVYTRDFNAACPSGTAPNWHLFQWNASVPSASPGDGSIVFTAVTAASESALSTATDTVTIGTAKAANSNPPPAAYLYNDLATLFSAANDELAWLRVIMTFNPSSNALETPTLYDWNQTFDCVPSE